MPIGRQLVEPVFSPYGRSHGFVGHEVRSRPTYDYGYPETREVFPGAQYPPLNRMKLQRSGPQPETWRVGHIKNTLALVSDAPLTPEQQDRVEFER